MFWLCEDDIRGEVRQAERLKDKVTKKWKINEHYESISLISQKEPFVKLWRGIDKHVMKDVAIKVYKKSHEPLVRDIQQKIIHNEVKALYCLRNAPNIVQMDEVLEDFERIYIILEYCPNGDLFEYIKDKGRLNESEARALFKQMLRAIKSCHNHSIAHRDVKLENFLFDETKQLKLCDFDQCGFMVSGKLFTEKRGSLAYSSPTIVEGKPYKGVHEDIWSLGVCLYTMLCGHFPFYVDNDPTATMERILKAPLKFTANLSDSCCNLLVNMLKKNRQERATLNFIETHPWLTST
jgi:serine/threonine protein kinase